MPPLAEPKVGWWPTHTSPAPLDGRSGMPAELVFPSGRAAIAQSLEANGLPSNASVGVTHSSADCLWRVVSRTSAPVDVSALNGRMLAAIVYEQWGWPVPAAAWQEISSRFGGRLLLVDRVDSADFFGPAARGEALPAGSVEVLSLSKLLGLPGGGLARADGAYVAFTPLADTASTRRLRTRSPAELERNGYSEMFKESRQVVHPAVLDWVRQNSLEAAAEKERLARRTHLEKLRQSRLADGWPPWMDVVLRRGAGPAWAPVLRGQDAARHWGATKSLDQQLGMIAAARVFNWSGNPLRPEYETCLALPVHSGVTDFDQVIAAID